MGHPSIFSVPVCWGKQPYWYIYNDISNVFLDPPSIDYSISGVLQSFFFHRYILGLHILLIAVGSAGLIAWKQILERFLFFYTVFIYKYILYIPSTCNNKQTLHQQKYHDKESPNKTSTFSSSLQRWRFVPWPLVLEKQVCWPWPAFTKLRQWWVDRSFGELFGPPGWLISSTYLTLVSWSTFEWFWCQYSFCRFFFRSKSGDFHLIEDISMKTDILWYMKIVRYKNQQDKHHQELFSHHQPRKKSTRRVYRTINLPALLGCLVFGHWLCWYCWLCLVFGLWISWYLFSGMDPKWFDTK